MCLVFPFVFLGLIDCLKGWAYNSTEEACQHDLLDSRIHKFVQSIERVPIVNALLEES